MTLNGLAAELLRHICDYLDFPSLQSVSLCDKSCRLVAVPVLFEAISIESHQAVRLKQLLQGNDYAKPKHIRTLEIRSRFPSTIRYEKQTFPDTTFLASFHATRCSSAENTSWEPLLMLLEDLTAVTDLIWTCPEQFPPSLLRHLQEKLPLCRLHLRNFEISSLVKHRAEIIDPHELLLVQSPNLHSIWFSYNIADTWNNEHKLPEAASRTVQGLAPNLRHVRLWEQMMGAEPDYSGYADLIRPLESATSMLSHEKGRLDSLHFAGHDQDVTIRSVEAWSTRTDFSVMKNLTFDCCMKPAVLIELAAHPFSSLAVLEMRLTIEDSDHDRLRSPPDESSKPAREILCSIPSLRALKLSGEMDHSCLRDAIRHHGKTLRTLYVEPSGFSPHRLSLPPEETSWIAEHCYVLEDLQLTMHRSQGDKSEVAAYSAIGKIATLQSLVLTLDASDYTSLRVQGEKSEDYMAKPKANFDKFGMENADMGEDYDDFSDPRKGHIMEMFINAALDEQLAWSIYSQLMKDRPNRALALDTIELQSDGCGDFGTVYIPPAIAKVANEIQHRWLFRRKYGFTTHGAFEVNEMEHANRLPTSNKSIFGIASNERDGETAASRDELDGRIESIFRRLWPAMVENSLWHSDWHGFDLSG